VICLTDAYAHSIRAYVDPDGAGRGQEGPVDKRVLKMARARARARAKRKMI
jgi:hypothetical protein